MKNIPFASAFILAGLAAAPVLAQGPLQQLRQADAASQSALISPSLENASLTAGAPADGSQSAVSGDPGASAGPWNKPTPTLSSAQEKISSAPPVPAEQAPPKEPMKLDTRDKVSIAIVAGGIALPFIVSAICGVGAPAVAVAGVIGIVVFIAGILVGGFFRPQPKPTP